MTQQQPNQSMGDILKGNWELIAALIVIIGTLITTFATFIGPNIFNQEDSYLYTILVVDADGQPIQNAEVQILDNTGHLVTNFTDEKGTVILNIPASILEKPGRMEVQKSNFVSYSRQIVITPNNLPARVPLEPIRQVAVPTATVSREVAMVVPSPSSTPTILSPTSIPSRTATAAATATTAATPTMTATSTLTPVPTNEPTNTAVPTIPPSPTPTEMPSEGNMLIVVAPVEVPVNIYTRDSDVTGAPRGRVSQGDVLEILDLNDDGDWYYVLVVKNGIEAWIQNDPNIVVPFDGEPPVISQDPVSEEQPVASGCLQVTITRIFKSNDIFDDVVLNWSNIPAEATRAQISVSGPTVSGETKLVVQPTFNDLKSSYTVQQWMFEAGNFSFNATYRYTVRVLAGSSEICTVAGTFEQ